MKVCYFGTYRAEYSRNQIMIEGLRRAGVDVIECCAQLWIGIEDRVQAATGSWIRPRFFIRVIRAYLNLLRQYCMVGDYDVMVVGYPGQFDVYLARLLTWLRRKPLVWDVFMSIYLIALERGLDQRSILTVRLLRQIERWACHLPERLILDTAEYVEWFHQTHGIDPRRFRLVPTGADDRIYRALETPSPDPERFTLIYYGSFIPNHGVRTMLEAAHILVDDPTIRFIFIGSGPEKDTATELSKRYGLDNVTFIAWIERDELPQYIAKADICLGVFGTTPQSLMTVQNKIYEALAMGKPVITGDSPTVREFFEHGKQVYLCARGDPHSLAEAIRVLRRDKDLRQTLSRGGQACFHSRFSMNALGLVLKRHLIELTNNQAVAEARPTL